MSANAMSKHFIDQHSMRDTQPPALDFVLPGFLAGTVGSIVAPGATGKSMVALQAAAYLAGGPDSLALGSVVRGPVLYLALEDDESVLAHRLHALHQSMDVGDSELVGRRLRVAALANTPFDIDDPAWLAAAAEYAEGCRLVVVDTLRQAHARDENCGTDMRHILQLLRRLAGQGRAVLFLHHVTKAAAMNGAGGIQQASRGSSVLTDNVRSQANLIVMSDDQAQKLGISETNRKEYVRLSWTKVNACAPLPDRWYRRGIGGLLNPVELELGNKPRPPRGPALAQGESSNERW